MELIWQNLNILKYFKIQLKKKKELNLNLSSLSIFKLDIVQSDISGT